MITANTIIEKYETELKIYEGACFSDGQDGHYGDPEIALKEILSLEKKYPFLREYFIEKELGRKYYYYRDYLEKNIDK